MPKKPCCTKEEKALGKLAQKIAKVVKLKPKKKTMIQPPKVYMENNTWTSRGSYFEPQHIQMTRAQLNPYAPMSKNVLSLSDIQNLFSGAPPTAQSQDLQDMMLESRLKELDKYKPPKNPKGKSPEEKALEKVKVRTKYDDEFERNLKINAMKREEKKGEIIYPQDRLKEEQNKYMEHLRNLGRPLTVDEMEVLTQMNAPFNIPQTQSENIPQTSMTPLLDAYGKLPREISTQTDFYNETPFEIKKETKDASNQYGEIKIEKDYNIRNDKEQLIKYALDNGYYGTDEIGELNKMSKAEILKEIKEMDEPEEEPAPAPKPEEKKPIKIEKDYNIRNVKIEKDYNIRKSDKYKVINQGFTKFTTTGIKIQPSKMVESTALKLTRHWKLKETKPNKLGKIVRMTLDDLRDQIRDYEKLNNITEEQRVKIIVD